MYSAEFTDRSGNSIKPAQITFTPERWAGTVRGGFTDATIKAEGQANHLTSLKDALGYKVTIRNEFGHSVWRGYVHEVQITRGSTVVALSLDRMFNRVRVKYSYEDGAGGHQEITDWLDDSWAQTLFGAKELIETADETRPADAEKLRAQLLAKHKLPQPVPSGTAYTPQSVARLQCRGRFDLLDWSHYEQPKGRIIHNPTSDASAILGWGFQAHIGFGRGDKTIHEIGCKFNGVRAGDKLLITGTYVPFLGEGYNDGIYTVAQENSQEKVASYTADTITFDPGDDIFDLEGGGLGVFKTGEMILVSGTGGANDKYHMLDGDGVSQITTWTGWNGPVFFWDSGVPVTITQGGHITVEEDFVKAIPGAGGSNPIVRVTTQKLAQRFSPAVTGSWLLGEIGLYIRRIGAPDDSVTASLYSDSGGAIGSLIEASTVTGIDIQQSEQRVAFEFDATTTISSGTFYWILVERTGTYNNEHYYEISLSESNLVDSLLEYTGEEWQSRTPLASMLHEVIGVRATTLQIQDMVSGSLLAGCNIKEASGVNKPLYRDGYTTRMEEILALLQFGYSDGRYMFADVSEGDILIIYPSPAYDKTNAVIWRDGRIIGQSGAELPLGALPYGNWMILADFPEMENQANSFSPVLLDTVEYDAQGNSYNWQVVGAEDRFST